MQLQLRYTKPTTPQLQLHYTTTTTTAALHHTTVGIQQLWWGAHCNHCDRSKKKHTHTHNFNNLPVQWILSAIHDSQQPTSPLGFLFLKLPPRPCAVLLASIHNNICQNDECPVCKRLETAVPSGKEQNSKMVDIIIVFWCGKIIYSKKKPMLRVVKCCAKEYAGSMPIGNAAVPEPTSFFQNVNPINFKNNRPHLGFVKLDIPVRLM